jgi:hypothetical protein
VHAFQGWYPRCYASQVSRPSPIWSPDKERRYVGGAFITLNEKMRERLRSSVNARASRWHAGGKLLPGFVQPLRDIIELLVERVAERTCANHDGESDKSGDQPIFDSSGAGFVIPEVLNDFRQVRSPRFCSSHTPQRLQDHLT